MFFGKKRVLLRDDGTPSLERLISNWADRSVRDSLYFDPKVFELQRSNQRNGVFVAYLWSGRSQMAFRQLCDSMKRAATMHAPVLVIDYDQGIPEPYATDATPHMTPGNGILLEYDSERLVGSEDGGKVEEYARLLEWIFT